jgi:hypothetical protein
MAVEMPSRGMTGETWQDRHDRIGELLDQQLSEATRRVKRSLIPNMTSSTSS